MRYGLLLLGLALLPAWPAALQDEAHPMDAAEEACIRSDDTMAGIARCMEEAYWRWDQALNRVYGELMERLDGEGRAALREAQRAWLRYRDREFDLIEALYAPLSGTMYVPMRLSDRAHVVRQRVLALEAYLRTLQEADVGPR